MTVSIAYRRLDRPGRGYWVLVAVLAGILLAGLSAAHHMESAGHHVTGMNNQVVWGIPHVFAVFLILAASGVLNVASTGSVFGHSGYAPLARLSGLLAIAALAGGLSILVLDLGRPDRLVVAMTHYNIRSVFAWNIFLYTGFFAVVAVYLWLLFEARLNHHARTAGMVAFVWRLVLTSGTGLIFGFLVARPAYDAAIMAPLFIAVSLALGMALFIVVMAALGRLAGRPPEASSMRRFGRLLALFIVLVLLLTAIHHLANLYVAEHVDAERFLLADGGVYPLLFWVGQFALGSILPLALLWGPRSRVSATVVTAAWLVIGGGVCQLYVIIVGGQALPMPVFPGMQVESSFFDGAVGRYVPSGVELVLVAGGIALSALVTLVAARVLPFLPERLDVSAGRADR